jgi:putative peptidoglycan lipid II flippase
LRSEGKEEEARELSSAVFLLLTIVSSIITLLGLIFTPQLIDIITPGFEGEVRELSIKLVRILFPGIALLVLSAWCLGVQNSHKKFLLSYSAPIFWNLAIIVALFLYGKSDSGIIYVTWGVTVGCVLQLLVQLPTSLKLTSGIKATLSFSNQSLKKVLSNFFPVVFSRGVVQISAFLDAVIASALPLGSLSSLTYAQILYLLPVSLFGMSVSASELPELSALKQDERANYLTRLDNAIHKVLFFVIPSAAAFVLIGDYLISIVFQSGAFKSEDTNRVWQALLILSIGMPLSSVSRLFASFFYSRNQAGELLKISLVRVLFSAALGATLSVLLGYGLNGLCIGTTLGAILEFGLLAKLLVSSLGTFPRLSKKLLIVIVSSIAAGFIGRALGNLEFASFQSAFLERIFRGLIPVCGFCLVFGTSLFLAGFRGSLVKFFK